MLKCICGLSASLCRSIKMKTYAVNGNGVVGQHTVTHDPCDPSKIVTHLTHSLLSTFVSSVFMALLNFFCLDPSLYLLVSWAWWDWPLTWLTNHRPSVLWRCWLGHLTRKIVSEMTYNVSSGTLNTTNPFDPLTHDPLTYCLLCVIDGWTDRQTASACHILLLCVVCASHGTN